MAISIPSLLLGGLLAGGIAEGVNALTSSGKNKMPGLPAAPSIDSAGATALDAQTQQRQAALLAGGQTNITGGSGIVLGSDVNAVTLVGSS